MGTLSGFRPPQFSEDDAWLPVWLHRSDFDQFDEEGIEKDHITFEQRVQELQFLQKGVGIAESSREEGGCKIGQLFISGTESSPFSYAQSLSNGVQFHLCLPSDDDSENTNQTTDAGQTKFNYPFIIQHPEESELLCHGDVRLNLFHNTGSTHSSPSMELKRHVNKKELLKHDENMHSVELCIAASEALVTNEVIESCSFENYASASAILEASLQVKQARLEVWKDFFDGSTNTTSEIDNLSDLDDITMESAYEDAGIHLNELSLNESSVSQVKDTFNSDYDETGKHEKIVAAATICDTSFNDSHAHIKEALIDDGRQSREDLATECFNGDTQKKVMGNSVCGLGTDIGYQDHCLRIVDRNAELHLSVSAKQGDNPITAENSLHEANNVEEQFKSRWLGGWTSNNEVKYTTGKHRIPKPFACETSFLSESAPDENSFVQNHIKGAIIGSQLNVHTENFYNRASADMLLSQDVRSSNTSLVDPLCSVVPCSISENICPSPALNYVGKVNPGHPNNTFECNKDNVKGTSSSENELAQVEKIDNEENTIWTALPESKSRCTYSENLQSTLILDETQSDEKLFASKRVRFCEKETKIFDKKKPRKEQTASKNCSSTSIKKIYSSSDG